MLGGYRIDPYGGLVDCPFSNMADNLAMLVEAVPPPRCSGNLSGGSLDMLTEPNITYQNHLLKPNEGNMMGLTSKQHLFMRVVLVVSLANAAIFYNLFLNPQVVTVPWQFTEFAVLATAITLFALTVNLLFWWKYQRNERS